MSNYQAFETLREHKARLHGSVLLGTGVELAAWSNCNDRVTQESADGQFGDIAGYMVWNMRGEYNFGPQLSNLTLGAGVKNLFDQRYFTRSNDNNFGKYVGEPRTFFVQGSIAF